MQALAILIKSHKNRLRAEAWGRGRIEQKVVRKLSKLKLKLTQICSTTDNCDFVLSKQFTHLLEIFSISIDSIWERGLGTKLKWVVTVFL
jgi:hypothetical protein